MPKFTIVWTKVIQDEDGLDLEAISIREALTLEDAETTAREIHGSCNDHILLKIYDHSMIDNKDPIALANEYFMLTLKRMYASIELVKRPIRKRKKKKL